MIELCGDLWTLPGLARCITTNGEVDRNGRAVMGRGCALEAARYDPALKADLGQLLVERGNHVHLLRARPSKPMLISFPVKHHWCDPADLELIERSAKELVDLCNVHILLQTRRQGCVLVPRPGCGAGQLDWDDVRPVLLRHLDDRFAAVHFE